MNFKASYKTAVQVITIILLTSLIAASSFGEEKINSYKINEKGIELTFNSNSKLNIGADVEFGLLRDGALYASFGLENQIFKFSKIVFNVAGNMPQTEDSSWFFKLDFAPIYDSIKVKSTPSQAIANYGIYESGLDGSNLYVDWYKNLGSKIYYLGNTPIIEALLGYKIGRSAVKAGRIKTMISFEDKEMFWQDDGKFAPMSYWLSRDLLSGVSYEYEDSRILISAGVFSGGNPTKGYSNYLQMVENPNTKSNNTPILGGKIQLKLDNLFTSPNYSGYIFTSYLKNTTGSTWKNQIGDGKRSADVAAHGIMWKIKFNDFCINNLNLFAQYTQFISGLKPNSWQSSESNPKMFKNISQKGFFVGAQTFLMENKIYLDFPYNREIKHHHHTLI
jgi:hypothetical protein